MSLCVRSLGKEWIKKYPPPPLLSCGKAFIVSGASSHLCWDGLLTFTVMMATQMVAEQSSLFRQLTGIVGGRRPGCLLVTSFYRQHGAERSRSPERTERCPIERTFGGMKNDCSWKPTKDPALNASCILKGAQGSWPLTPRAGLVVPNWLRLAGKKWRDATCPIEGCLGGPRQPATWLPKGGLYNASF